MIGDGEAETGPLATSWHANKFLNPVTDGAVLPILHLNGYKIANPTVLARIPEFELRALLAGIRLAAADGDAAASTTRTPHTYTSCWRRRSTRPATRSRASSRPRAPAS